MYRISSISALILNLNILGSITPRPLYHRGKGSVHTEYEAGLVHDDFKQMWKEVVVT
jgi:hypothetical protein